jgi:hypothetical protein
LVVALLAGLLLLAPVPIRGGDGTTSPSSSSADARSYASEYGVDIGEAARRLGLQELVGEVGARIAADEAATYAGHWIEHQPAFKVVFAFTSDGDRMRRYFDGTPLESVVEIRSASFTAARLEADVQRLLADPSERPFDLEIDTIANRIDIGVLSLADFAVYASKTNLSVPDTARVVLISKRPTPAANMYAGRPLTDCTSGFSVQKSSTNRGISTAGHCGNSETWVDTGQALAFQAQSVGGSHDEQWHKRSDATIKNWAWDGNPDWRWITGKRHRNNQSVGDYVCKFGKSTGYGCGNIVSKSTTGCVADPNATFIKVHNSSGQDLANGGDSGGPWYISETALGITSCQQGIDAHYTAENYVESGLGVSIMASP